MPVDPKLLAAVLANPLDDAPRLVLADALTEAGDPHGELIVVQCLLAQRGLSPARRAQLKRRSATLSEAKKGAWAKDLEGLRWTLRRGFVDNVTGAAKDVAAKAQTLFATHPVTRLGMHSATPELLGELSNAGAFDRVAQLTISGAVGDDGAKVLAAAFAKRKQPLTALNLGRAGIGAIGINALAGAIEGCKSLVLTNNEIGDDGMASFAASKKLGALETLYASECGLGDDAAVALAKGASLGALTRLAIARNFEITSEGLRAIAKSKKLRRLRWLEFSNEDEMQQIVVRGR